MGMGCSAPLSTALLFHILLSGVTSPPSSPSQQKQILLPVVKPLSPLLLQSIILVLPALPFFSAMCWSASPPWSFQQQLQNTTDSSSSFPGPVLFLDSSSASGTTTCMTTSARTSTSSSFPLFPSLVTCFALVSVEVWIQVTA